MTSKAGITAPAPSMPAPGTIGRCAILALCLLALAAGLCALPHSTGPAAPAAFLLALALPGAAFGAYLGQLRRQHALGMWAPASRVARLLGGPWLRIGLALLGAMALAVLAALRLSAPEPRDIALLALAPVAFVALRAALRPRLVREWRAPFAEGRALLWIAMITTGALVLLDTAAMQLIPAAATPELATALRDLQPHGSSPLGDSALAALAADTAALWTAFEAQARAFAADAGAAAALATDLGLAALRAPALAAATFLAAAFFLPSDAFRRLLASATAATPPAPPSRQRAGVFIGMAAALLGVIYPMLVFQAERLARHHYRDGGLGAAAIQHAEMIGDALYRPGTMERLRAAQRAHPHPDPALRAQAAEALDAGFETMRLQVDPYLDWYYSLPAEWGRLAALLGGDIERHLQDRLRATLEAPAPFAEFEALLFDAATQETRARAAQLAAARRILSENRLDPRPGTDLQITGRMPLEQALALPGEAGFTTTAHRFGIAGPPMAAGGAAVGAMVTRGLLAHSAMRGTLHGAAMALGRVAALRGGSATGGAATGAAVGAGLGSVVPGLGTAIGATLGGVVGGLGAGVAGEYLILKLEEHFARPAHKARILEAIDRTQRDMHAGIAATGEPRPGQ